MMLSMNHDAARLFLAMQNSAGRKNGFRKRKPTAISPPKSTGEFVASGISSVAGKADSVKTRSNSFHSTLEPNTEVFSKVSRSLAQFTLVNSVSTLLNKGGITCNCPNASQDLCAH